MTLRADLSGRRALVTGASRGIGRAIARALAACGAEVVCAARSAAAVEESADEIRRAGGRAVPLAMDVGDPASVAAALGPLAEEAGGVGILVNNAGIADDGLLVRMSEEQWRRVLDTNLDGAFRTSRLLVRGMMKARWGRIVNVSSVVGQMGNPGQANYAASKAGLFGLTKALARELAGRGITVNAVAPGFIDTAMTGSLPERAREELLKLVPLGRLGTPEDVAAAVVYLASDAAAYVTGHVVNVNGGMYM